MCRLYNSNEEKAGKIQKTSSVTGTYIFLVNTHRGDMKGDDKED